MNPDHKPKDPEPKPPAQTVPVGGTLEGPPDDLSGDQGAGIAAGAPAGDYGLGANRDQARKSGQPDDMPATPPFGGGPVVGEKKIENA
jgi:hypothetical protein